MPLLLSFLSNLLFRLDLPSAPGLVATPSLAPEGRIDGLLILVELIIDSCLLAAYSCYLLFAGEVVVYSSAFAALVTLGAFTNLFVDAYGATSNIDFSNFDLTRSFEVDLFP